jgi:hypothetical protein
LEDELHKTCYIPVAACAEFATVLTKSITVLDDFDEALVDLMSIICSEYSTV